MSRQSKQSKRLAAAREMSKLRQSGGKGPSRTESKHGKKKAWWQIFPSYNAFISGGKRGQARGETAEA